MIKIVDYKQLTILIATTDLELLDRFQMTLSKYFKKIIICTNGLEAHNLFKQNIIDMIIIDHILIGMNGYDLCNKIRQINKKIPITMISNDLQKDILLKVIPLKLTEYLLKPINYLKLFQALDLMASELIQNNLLNRTRIFHDFSYDFYNKKLINIREEKEILMTKSEIIFIELLITNMNNTVLHNTIDNVFMNTKSEQAIKNLVYRLRSKLGKNLIENSHGIGYILNEMFKSSCNVIKKI